MLRTLIYFLLLTIALASAAIAQVETQYPKVTGTFDASTAIATYPNKSGLSAALPGTCTVGQTYFKTDAVAGSNTVGCTSTNTWTAQGGGGGSVTASHEYTLSGTATSGSVGASPGTAIYSQALTAGELKPGKCMVLQFSIDHVSSAAGAGFDLDIGGVKFALFSGATGTLGPFIWPYIQICNNNALVANQLGIVASPFQFGTSLNLIQQQSFGSYTTGTVNMTGAVTVAVFAYGAGDTVAGRGFSLRVGQ